jgi:hypothetical protein
VKRFPEELEALLSPRGKRLLAGRDGAVAEALARDGAVVVTGLFDAKAVRAAPALLAKTFRKSLTRVETKAPPPAEAGTLSALERLPRMERVSFAPFGAVDSNASTRAEEIGLTALCRSESFRALAAALTGAPKRAADTHEVLALAERDYLGPRPGHFAGAEAGAVELFLSFASGVKRQFLVHEREGHLEAMHELPDGPALVAVSRPRWRYLTPLEGTKAAQRWLVGQSFEPEVTA